MSEVSFEGLQARLSSISSELSCWVEVIERYATWLLKSMSPSTFHALNRTMCGNGTMGHGLPRRGDFLAPGSTLVALVEADHGVVKSKVDHKS